MTTVDIGSLTMDEIGWKRLSGTEMRWVGKPDEQGDRAILRLKGHSFNALEITSAVLYGSGDPGDNEFDEGEVDAALAGYAVHGAVLDLPALHVLHFALTSVIAAMEAVQGVSISYEPGGPSGGEAL